MFPQEKNKKVIENTGNQDSVPEKIVSKIVRTIATRLIGIADYSTGFRSNPCKIISELDSTG